jgi:hypothetical protein
MSSNLEEFLRARQAKYELWIHDDGALTAQEQVRKASGHGEGQAHGIVTERDGLKAFARTLVPVRGIDPDTYLW